MACARACARAPFGSCWVDAVNNQLTLVRPLYTHPPAHHALHSSSRTSSPSLKMPTDA